MSPSPFSPLLLSLNPPSSPVMGTSLTTVPVSLGCSRHRHPADGHSGFLTVVSAHHVALPLYSSSDHWAQLVGASPPRSKRILNAGWNTQVM